VKLKPDAPPPEFKATRVATPRSITELDPSTPPADASAIQVVTPSDMFSWPGPDVHLTGQSGRTGIENNWYAHRAHSFCKSWNGRRTTDWLAKVRQRSIV